MNAASESRSIAALVLEMNAAAQTELRRLLSGNTSSITPKDLRRWMKDPTTLPDEMQRRNGLAPSASRSMP